jgi:hypothetical protein
MTEKQKKTLVDLRATHDKNVVIPNRIKAALAALAASGDEFAYEGDFIALTKPKISTTDFAKFRSQFVDFWAEVSDIGSGSNSKRVWFPTKKLADKWKVETSHG